MTRTRVEADREDLMAEAANLRERIELRVPSSEVPVTIGCNDQGHWSFYFGADPMYRFDAEGRLRRAVKGGKLFRTQGSTLAELERVRRDNETQLQRRDLSLLELEVFLQEAQSHLSQLYTAYSSDRCQTLREIGTTADWAARFTGILELLTTDSLSLAPAITRHRTNG